MGRLRFSQFSRAMIVTALGITLAGCGGSKPPGPSPFAATVRLTPAVSVSLQEGALLSFTASPQNGAGQTVSAPITFQSSDTSILNVAPNGVACAGKWDAQFINCTPKSSGVVQVTASALGATSVPTLVFVHPPIDAITVTEVALTPPRAIEPCLPQGQSMTIQANAFSQGADITGSVGAFIFSAASSSVVKIVPITTSSTTVVTNQATATAETPGLTQIFASASGISSTPFQQVGPSPNIVWDFFETCPVQSVSVELGPEGTQQTGQTSFVTNKGDTETVSAIVLDVFGNILKNVPLTWSSSQPTAILAGSASTGCAAGGICSITTPQPGSGSVTAACTPPTCNAGFPQVPAGLSSVPYQNFIPLPVYSTGCAAGATCPPPIPSAISGVVNGAPTAASVLATSRDCAGNFLCGVALYDIPTTTNLAGNPTGIPEPPNSILFDPAADKAYLGSAFGALSVNPANLGGTTSAFTSLGAARGQVLATSRNGAFAVFSDTLSTPNEVYVVNTTSGSASTVTLNISGANVAAFSLDGFEAMIVGNPDNSSGCPTASTAPGSCLYVYSPLEALQRFKLDAPVSAIEFSTNGGFAYLSGGEPSAITVRNTCNNLPATDSAAHTQIIPLPVAPNLMKVLPDAIHIIALDSTGFDYITSSVTAPPAGTMQNPGSQCPAFISNTDGTSTLPSSKRLELGQGTISPINFFMSPDGSKAYIAASDRSSILVYDFNANTVSAIQLLNNATPVSADITTDGTLIYVAASDGSLHQVSTLSSADLVQTPFPSGFCLQGQTQISCAVDLIAVKP
jgi:hypothetical protein